MHIRCNGWNDYCFGRRARVLSDKKHRNLVSKCRELGQFCKDHGLVFPFAPPQLEEPYEPRIQELEQFLEEADERFSMMMTTEQQELPQNNDFELQVQQASSESLFPLRVPTL